MSATKRAAAKAADAGSRAKASSPGDPDSRSSFRSTTCSQPKHQSRKRSAGRHRQDGSGPSWSNQWVSLKVGYCEQETSRAVEPGVLLIT